MAIVFALAAAIAWGSSDFAAGYASRRSSALSVVILTHFASATALFVLVVDAGALASGRLGFHGNPAAADLAWGAAAGIAGGLGALLLFRGLGRGSMAVVAPITAAGAALIPAAVGVATGDDLGPVALAGVVVAIIAIVMISLTGGDEPGDAGVGTVSGGAVSTLVVVDRPTTSSKSRLLQSLRTPAVTDALLSGVGFGLFFVAISRADGVAGDWPLFVARLASFSLFAIGALVTRVAVLPARADRPSVVLAGVLDAAAAFCFVLATRHGLLSIGAVLASLYPGATVVLARMVADERIGRAQIKGLVLAVVAVAMLAS